MPNNKYPERVALYQRKRSATCAIEVEAIDAEIRAFNARLAREKYAKGSDERKAAKAKNAAVRESRYWTARHNDYKARVEANAPLDEVKRVYHLHRSVYYAMKFRCYSEKCSQYKDYGGRGITVCDRWLESFDNFIADMGFRPFEDFQLDRIDNNGNYEPDNCRWVSRSVNMSNRRPYQRDPNWVPAPRAPISPARRERRRIKMNQRYYAKRIAKEMNALTPLVPSPVTASVIAHFGAVSGVETYS